MKQILIAFTLMATSMAYSSTGAETAMEIPFAFKAGDLQFLAGTYRVRIQPIPSGKFLLILRDNEGRQRIVLPSGQIRNTMPTAGTVGFVFLCETDDNCQLSEVYSGGGPAFQVRR